MTPSTEKRVKSNILFICGLIWISYFAFWNPEAMNPYFMMIGGSSLFGPAVIGLWKADTGDKPMKDNEKE